MIDTVKQVVLVIKKMNKMIHQSCCGPAAQVATSLKKKNKGQADFVANSLRLGASCQVRMSDNYACLASGSNFTA